MGKGIRWTEDELKAVNDAKARAGTKYNAVRTVVHNIPFASKMEAARYRVLELRKKAGEIADLKHHVRFPLVVNEILICEYEADFVYQENGARVVEDVKGVRTSVYKLKKKLMAALYGVAILETGKEGVIL